MNTVCRYPENRTALQRKRCADTHQIFNPLWCLVSTMCQEPVITHPDSDIDGQDIKDGHNCEALPTKEKEGRECPGMKNDDDHKREPIHSLAYSCCAAHTDEFSGRNCMT